MVNQKKRFFYVFLFRLFKQSTVDADTNATSWGGELNARAMEKLLATTQRPNIAGKGERETKSNVETTQQTQLRHALWKLSRMLGIYSIRICFASRRGQPRLTNVDSARRESNDCWYFVDYRKLFRSLMTLPLILKLLVIESLHGIICRIKLKKINFSLYSIAFIMHVTH